MCCCGFSLYLKILVCFRPLPPLPDLEISEDSVVIIAHILQEWINCVLCLAREITIGRNVKLFIQVVCRRILVLSWDILSPFIWNNEFFLQCDLWDSGCLRIVGDICLRKSGQLSFFGLYWWGLVVLNFLVTQVFFFLMHLSGFNFLLLQELFLLYQFLFCMISTKTTSTPCYLLLMKLHRHS